MDKEAQRRIEDWNRKARENQAEKRERARQAWQPGWEARIYQFINENGCRTMAEFLTRYPGEPYVSLAARLALPIVPIHLSQLQIKEAKHNGTLRNAAMDALVRELNFCVPKGWNMAPNADFEEASAYVDWVGILTDRINAPEIESAARKVFDALRDLSPPKGWRPIGPHDPLIQKAFDQGWPIAREDV